MLACLAGTAVAFWLALSVRGRRRERLLWLTGFALLAGPAGAAYTLLEPPGVDGTCHLKPIQDLVRPDEAEAECRDRAVRHARVAAVGGGLALLVAGGAAVGAWRDSG